MSLAAVVAGLLAVSLPAASGVELPAGEAVIASDAVSAFELQGAAGEAELITADAQPFEGAVRIRTRERTPDWWSVQWMTHSLTEVRRGDVLHCTFYARGIESVDETGIPRGRVYFQEAGAPWRKSLLREFEAGPEWQRYDFPFAAQRSLGAGEAMLAFAFGYPPQTIEIGGVSLTNYRDAVRLRDLPMTSYTYAGMDPDAPWREGARDRIEQYRKAQLTIRVTDANGLPVPGARVHVRMMRHAFPFGSAISSAYIQSPRSDPAEVARYREMIVRLFSTVAIENHLKWPGYLEWGGKDSVLDTLRWLKSENIPARGHVLVWPSWRNAPSFLRERFENDPDGLRKAIAEWITEIAGRTRGLLYEWDVLNEPVSKHVFMDMLGEEEMVEWFRLARQADPDVRLMINEFNIINGGHIDGYERIIRFLLDNGAPLNGIGIQSHLGMRPPGIPHVLAVLDRLSKFELPLIISEFDQPTSDEALQGRFMRDYMTAVFSHPAVDSFIMWGFWEPRHWRPEGALFRRDWSIKPNGQAYLDLVFDEWWTDEELATGPDGTCTVRAFLGSYEVEAAGGGLRKRALLDLLPEGTELEMQLP
jgi:GH35 family endo-1,4-beta-xylanase